MKEKNRSLIIIMHFIKDSETFNYLLNIYHCSGFDVLCKTREEATKFYTSLMERGYRPFNNFETASKCNYILFSVNSIPKKEFGTMGINDLVEYFELEDNPEEIDCYFASNIIYQDFVINQKKINIPVLKDLIKSYIGNFNLCLKIESCSCFYLDRVDINLSFIEKINKDSKNVPIFKIYIDYSNLDNVVISFLFKDIPEGLLWNFQTDYIRDKLMKFVKSSNFFIGA